MDNSIKPVPQESVQMVTPDLYLNRALQTLICEGPLWLDSADPDDNNAVRVVLIDIACMGSSLAEQKDLMALLRSADAYALMSYSEASFNMVPHLNLSRQVTEIKLELVRLMITLTGRLMPVMERLFSCLNHS